MKYGASIDVSSISIQCEVTTQLKQNLAVTSSVKLEKSNNVDMKNWSAVKKYGKYEDRLSNIQKGYIKIALENKWFRKPIGKIKYKEGNLNGKCDE